MGQEINYYDYIMPSIENRSLKTCPKEDEYNFRITKAKQQASMEPVNRDTIVKYVNEFLAGLGMIEINHPHIKPKERETRRIDYCNINQESKEDIVWIKFTTDNYISVIGTSCDISFSQYAMDNTTAGIINKVLDKRWDETDVLIFPLKKIPEHLNRSDIESGIGNYLISKGVPILDFYSHNY